MSKLKQYEKIIYIRQLTKGHLFEVNGVDVEAVFSKTNITHKFVKGCIGYGLFNVSGGANWLNEYLTDKEYEKQLGEVMTKEWDDKQKTPQKDLSDVVEPKKEATSPHIETPIEVKPKEEKKKPTLRQKLRFLQTELKVPKGQKNGFGNYKYRSCEDILEAIKPILKKLSLVLTLSDEIVAVGDYVYVNVTAKLIDVESGESIETKGIARDSIEQKGMAAPQCTGSASSYARKYTLGGLLLLDDTKDDDTKDNK